MRTIIYVRRIFSWQQHAFEINRAQYDEIVEHLISGGIVVTFK